MEQEVFILCNDLIFSTTILHIVNHYYTFPETKARNIKPLSMESYDWI